MDESEFVEALRESEATELRRLGSDKYLIAATGADLEEVPVLRTVGATAASGRETFEAWADDEREIGAATFAAAAETEAENYERVVGALGDVDEVPDPGEDPVHAALQSADETVERAGAMVGRGLVGDRTHLQVVNFFVNEGDRELADVARDVRATANDQIDAGGELLADCCDDEDDWERARHAATDVVAAAYDDYVESLEAMGVDPKPVC